MADDETLKYMRENGIPITRENYIDCIYAAGDRPEWTAEFEDQLPEFLRLREDGSDPTSEPSSADASRPRG